MLHRVTEFLSAALPKPAEAVLMSIGGSLGALATFAFGEIDNAAWWFFVFVIVDYVTGTAASFKEGEWCSSAGFVGLFRKAFMFFVVALCHGLDEIAGTELLRNAAIFAYSINECGSIIENLERLGLGYLIPGVIRRGLRQLKKQEDEMFTEEEGETENDRETNSN